jgi:predicted metalloendopeptidase
VKQSAPVKRGAQVKRGVSAAPTKRVSSIKLNSPRFKLFYAREQLKMIKTMIRNAEISMMSSYNGPSIALSIFDFYQSKMIDTESRIERLERLIIM